MQTKTTKAPNRRMVPRTCEQCGRTFLALPPNKRHTRRYCSLTCAGLAHRSRVSLVCEVCGKSFERTPFMHKKRVFTACSKACSAALDTRTISERLDKHTNRNGPIPLHAPELGPCAEWTASLNTNGYGQIMMLREDGTYQPDRAHRVAWIEASGAPVPDGMNVCHACDNPKCRRSDGEGVWVVNGIAHRRLGHLFLGTDSANLQDMAQKGRAAMHRAILTWSDIATIRDRYAAGERVTAIARDYPVGHQQISRIVRNERWRIY